MLQPNNFEYTSIGNGDKTMMNEDDQFDNAIANFEGEGGPSYSRDYGQHHQASSPLYHSGNTNNNNMYATQATATAMAGTPTSSPKNDQSYQFLSSYPQTLPSQYVSSAHFSPSSFSRGKRKLDETSSFHDTNTTSIEWSTQKKIVTEEDRANEMDVMDMKFGIFSQNVTPNVFASHPTSSMNAPSAYGHYYQQTATAKNTSSNANTESLDYYPAMYRKFMNAI